MKKLRRVHLWLGCFFSPLLLFYIGTGWYQTLNLNRNKSLGEATDWITRLRSVHVDQVYPAAGVERYSTGPYKVLVVLMAITLIATVVIGIILAFQVSRRKWPVFLALGLGILLPVVVLWLGQHR
jgi:hypothetical protein